MQKKGSTSGVFKRTVITDKASFNQKNDNPHRYNPSETLQSKSRASVGVKTKSNRARESILNLSRCISKQVRAECIGNRVSKSSPSFDSI